MGPRRSADPAPRPRQGVLRRLAPYAAPYVAAGVVGLLAAVVFVESGIFNVGATSPHTQLTYWLTHTTMERSVRRAALAISPPASFTADQAAEGFRLYEVHCVGCHGAPGVGPEATAAGFMPPPPYLIEAAHVWRPAELFWIVRNGVKMTAMPAWDTRLDDRQTWAVVAFLTQMPKLSAADYQRMRQELSASSGPARAQLPPP
jgi:mono/diheme cytochrome c family protein